MILSAFTLVMSMVTSVPTTTDSAASDCVVRCYCYLIENNPIYYKCFFDGIRFTSMGEALEQAIGACGERMEFVPPPPCMIEDDGL